jgi:hypothetical protein
MSTVFKLLGSNSTVDEEVNRIVGLEKGFMAVCIISCICFHFFFILENTKDS